MLRAGTNTPKYTYPWQPHKSAKDLQGVAYSLKLIVKHIFIEKRISLKILVSPVRFLVAPPQKGLISKRNRAFFVSQGVASVEIVGIEMLFLLRITSLNPAYCRKRLFLYIRCNRWGCGEIKAVHYFVLPLPCTIFAI